MSGGPDARNVARAYRRDIDGLRAFAVLAVIFYHAGIPGFAGGFVGVDVFFVISGYLITRLIVADLDEQRFSFGRFYIRRIRRILPALVIVCALCIPPAIWLMLPDDLENFGQSLVATSLSANNLLLSVTAGYFEMDSEFKPLMHTWSLGVEEQYYIVVPVLIWAAYRIRGRKSVAVAMVLVTILSFAWCLLARHRSPSVNFYWLSSRAWELGAGALLSLCGPFSVQRRWKRVLTDVATVSAAAALVCAVVLLDDVSLPGPLSLAPVAAACILIGFGDESRGVNHLLAARPIVGCGLLSYSAYLIHQPIFAFVRIVHLEQPSRVLFVLLIPAILMLAWISWRFVETPFRQRWLTKPRTAITFAVSTGTALAGLGLLFHMTSGFYTRVPELSQRDQGFGAKQNERFNKAPFRLVNKRFSDTTRVQVLVLGNSFARDFINMLESSKYHSSTELSYSDVGDCVSTLPVEIREAARVADMVVLGSGVTASTLPCALRRIHQLQSINSGTRVVVLGTKGFGWNNNAVMLLPPAVRYSFRAKLLDSTIRDNAAGRAGVPASYYVDILALIADAEERVAVFTPDRRFISQDRKHLTEAGAEYLATIVLEHPHFGLLRVQP